jgi:hypothetical protein
MRPNKTSNLQLWIKMQIALSKIYGFAKNWVKRLIICWFACRFNRKKIKSVTNSPYHPEGQSLIREFYESYGTIQSGL